MTGAARYRVTGAGLSRRPFALLLLISAIQKKAFHGGTIGINISGVDFVSYAAG